MKIWKRNSWHNTHSTHAKTTYMRQHVSAPNDVGLRYLDGEATVRTGVTGIMVNLDCTYEGRDAGLAGVDGAAR